MSSLRSSIPRQMSRENLGNIVAGILSHKISFITGSTGTGKSTIVPAAVAYQGYLKAEKQSGRANLTRTIVAVPTIASALSLAARTREIYPELKIGHAAENVKAYDDSCDLVFATAGHVYRKYLRKFQIKDGKRTIDDLTEFPVIFVDEAHTGTVDNTIIVALWEYVVNVVKLESKFIPLMVLTTATEVPGITTSDERFIFRASVEIPSPYHKEILYTSKDYRGVEVSQAMADLAAAYHHANPYRRDMPLGKILIFVSGSAQALTVEKLLRAKSLRDVEILTVYSSLDDEDRNRVFMKFPAGMRMIIIGTNILESSITIEDVAYVIDGMREKIPSATPTGGIRLGETWISRKSAEQRAGRTGRTMNGVVQRMVTRDRFVSSIFKENKTFDIERVPLHEQILEVIASGLPVNKILRGANTATKKDTMNDLVGLGMVEGMDDDLRVTERGLFVTKFPLGVRPAAFLYRWLYPPPGRKPFNPIIGIIIASLIDEDPSRIFKQYYDPDPNVITPDKLAQKQAVKNAHQRFAGEDHLVTVLNVWMMFQRDTNIDLLEPYPAPEYMDQFFQYRNGLVGEWFANNKIERHVFYETERIVRRCATVVRRLDFVTDNVGFDPAEVAVYARPLLEKINKDLIMDTTMTAGVFKNKNRRFETMNYHLSDSIIPTTVDLRDAESLTAVIVYESTMGVSSKHIIRFAVRNNRRLVGSNFTSGNVTVDDLDMDPRLLLIPDIMLPGIIMADYVEKPEQTFRRKRRGFTVRPRRTPLTPGPLLHMESRSSHTAAPASSSGDVTFGAALPSQHGGYGIRANMPVKPAVGGKVIAIEAYDMNQLKEITTANTSGTGEDGGTEEAAAAPRPAKKVPPTPAPTVTPPARIVAPPSFSFGQKPATSSIFSLQPKVTAAAPALDLGKINFAGFKINPPSDARPLFDPSLPTPVTSLPAATPAQIKEIIQASTPKSIFALPAGFKFTFNN